MNIPQVLGDFINGKVLTPEALETIRSADRGIVHDYLHLYLPKEEVDEILRRLNELLAK